MAEKHTSTFQEGLDKPRPLPPALAGKDAVSMPTHEPYLFLPACQDCELCTGLGNFDANDGSLQRNDNVCSSPARVLRGEEVSEARDPVNIVGKWIHTSELALYQS
jgi:hypothetical protein